MGLIKVLQNIFKTIGKDIEMLKYGIGKMAEEQKRDRDSISRQAAEINSIKQSVSSGGGSGDVIVKNLRGDILFIARSNT